MTLTTRLTSFFLGVLACVLVGFAVGLYCLANNYLHRQAAERLTSALHTLAASADVGPEGVEWEPNSRSLNLGQDPSADQVRWLVRDDRGGEVDRSRNLSTEESKQFLSAPASLADEDQVVAFRSGESWRLRQMRIAIGAERTSKESAAFTSDPAPPNPAATTEKIQQPLAKLHRALQLTVGVSLAPVDATLRNLALALAGLSLMLWCVAAIGGRWLCRRALSPVTRMADTARHMNADDWRTRLPLPGTGDELEDLAHAFNDLLTRLEESFERQRRFTGDASHQLRTPLTAMLGQVDVALLRERSPDEYRRALEAVQSQAHRLRQIVETQLFLARADAEALGPHREPVDLAVWLPEHLQSWRDHPRWPDFRCEIVDEQPALVQTHPPLLAQLLDNLLDNAAKYSPPGTSISVRLTADDTWSVLAVEDAGCGIAPNDLPHVFEPFFRSDQVRRLGVNGAGLGLAVAQRIAAALGGDIHAENLGTGGARFSLRLSKRRIDASSVDNDVAVQTAVSMRA